MQEERKATGSEPEAAPGPIQEDTLKQDGTPKRRRVSIRRFILTYFVLMGAFLFLMRFQPILHHVDINNIYSKSLVVITNNILNILNVKSSYHGTILNLPGISLDVKFGCNGLEAVMIYVVAILSFPAQWKKKLLGIAIGFIAIQVINIARITALAYAAVHFQEQFETIHTYVAQGIMIAIVLGIFFIYLHYATRTK
jgi:exosortase H (IPTLxxWG-CTERM-specific)